MRPPSASISRTRWPFAVPPIAGLHGMCATVSADSVHRPTRAPSLAAEWAASQPAWPAPSTITSKRSFKDDDSFLGVRVLCGGEVFPASFADAEPRENLREHIFRRSTSENFLERGAGV